jgi:sec-independent protein translocase protein TatB
VPPGLNPIHVLVVLVVALIVLGPEKLPDAARTLGRFINDVRTWSATMQAEARDMLDVAHRSDEAEPQPADLNGSAGAGEPNHQ